jgi:hypothetical protein
LVASTLPGGPKVRWRRAPNFGRDAAAGIAKQAACWTRKLSRDVNFNRPQTVEASRWRLPPGVPEVEPFVTGRSEGTGLGLTIVNKIARANGGKIRLLKAVVASDRGAIRRER